MAPSYSKNPYPLGNKIYNFSKASWCLKIWIRFLFGNEDEEKNVLKTKGQILTFSVLPIEPLSYLQFMFPLSLHHVPVSGYPCIMYRSVDCFLTEHVYKTRNKHKKSETKRCPRFLSVQFGVTKLKSFIYLCGGAYRYSNHIHTQPIMHIFHYL